MRYGIFSDIHSNLEALKAVIDAYETEGIDRYLCVGDVVGYAANPRECIDKVRSFAEVTVAGNHDWASAGLFCTDYFNPVAKEAIVWTRHKLDDKNRYFLESLGLVYKNEDLTLAHGTLENPSEFNYMTNGYIAWRTFGLLETNICFVGHSHIVGSFTRDKDEGVYYRQDYIINIDEDNQYIINVGSVGQPRDGDPNAAYCTYDTEKKQVQIKRIDYDIPTTREKIIRAGLPRYLGDRLLLGR